MELAELVKNHARALGCDLVGVCSIGALKAWEEEGRRILPNTRSVVVVGCRLSRAALDSDNIRVAQFDTHCVYDKLDMILNGLSVLLEVRSF